MVSTLLASKSKYVRMKAASCSLSRNRIISCIHWSSVHDLALGFRGGDTLIINLDDEEGKGLVLTEYVLRDAAFFRVLWNGLMQTESFDKSTLGLHSIDIKENNQRMLEKIIFSVDNEGVLRVWNTKSRKCVVQASLSQVLKDFVTFQFFQKGEFSVLAYCLILLL